MHRRLAFENHHRRAPQVLPGITPGRETTTPSATRVPATTSAAAAAPTTPQATRQVTTPVVAATTIATKDDKKDDKKQQDDDVPTTSTPPTTRVAPTVTSSTTLARTTSRTTSVVPTTSVLATSTSASSISIAEFTPTTSSQVQQFTVTRTTKPASTSSSGFASPTATPDDGPSVGSIAGYAAAALAGVAVISMLAIWIIRRKRRREQDADIDAAPFNRDSWLRHSTMIHDDPSAPVTTTTTTFPLPHRGDPEMIDRSFNSTPVANYAGAGMNHYPQNNFGYATQPSYQPGAVIFSPSSANTSFGPGGSPATPLPYSPAYDPTTPNPFEQQAGYTEVTRGGPPSPYNPYHHQQQFDDIQRQMSPSAPSTEDRSFSPRAPSPTIEAAPPVLPPIAPSTPGAADTFTRVPDYPELSPAPTSAHGHVVEVRASTYEEQATPVQYGFADAPHSPVAPSATTGPPPFAAPHPAAGRTLTRPETVYDTEDAYGGI